MSFRTGPSVFKDRGKVSFDYVPEKLPHREAQVDRLFSIFRPMGDSGLAANAFLYGSVRTAKTHNAERVGEEAGKGNVSLILISERRDAIDRLDAAATSTFRRTNAVEFPKYSEEELADILKIRVALAFHPGTVDDKIVGLIADIASDYGDARYAIDLLEGAGAAADAEIAGEVGPEHVRIAKAG